MREKNQDILKLEKRNNLIKDNCIKFYYNTSFFVRIINCITQNKVEILPGEYDCLLIDKIVIKDLVIIYEYLNPIGCIEKNISYNIINNVFTDHYNIIVNKKNKLIIKNIEKLITPGKYILGDFITLPDILLSNIALCNNKLFDKKSKIFSIIDKMLIYYQTCI